ncbi:hypothetical protein Tco_1429142 [Tanacetum coccineum]
MKESYALFDATNLFVAAVHGQQLPLIALWEQQGVKSDKEVVDLIDADIEDGNIVNILNCAERIICLSQKSSPSYPGTRNTIENVHVPDGNQDYLHNLCESHFAILE